MCRTHAFGDLDGDGFLDRVRAVSVKARVTNGSAAAEGDEYFVEYFVARGAPDGRLLSEVLWFSSDCCPTKSFTEYGCIQMNFESSIGVDAAMITLRCRKDEPTQALDSSSGSLGFVHYTSTHCFCMCLYLFVFTSPMPAQARKV